MSIRRSLAITTVAQVITSLLSLIGVVVVSRLLSPAEIGVFSVAASLLAIAHVFREFGIGQYLVQSADVSRERIRAAFTVMLVTSTLISGALFVVRHPIADFYGEPGMARVIGLIAANFLLAPFGLPTLALLRREMQFGRIAAILIGSGSIQLAVTIFGAATGLSYMSMAWGSLAGTITQMVLLTIIRPDTAFLFPSFTGLRDIVTFGLGSSTNSILKASGKAAPELIFGRTLGLEAVGLFSRGNGLLNMIRGQLTIIVQRVFLPAFANDFREGRDSAAIYTLSSANIVATMAPALAFAALAAGPLIEFAFGPQWSKSAPLASLLCVAALIQVPFTLADPALIAAGHVSLLWRLQLRIQTLRAAALLASIWLPMEVVVAMMIPVALITNFWYSQALQQALKLQVGQFWPPIRQGYVVTLLSLTAPVALLTINWRAEFLSGAASTVLISGVLFVASWTSSVLLLRHPVANELKLLTRWIRELSRQG